MERHAAAGRALIERAEQLAEAAHASQLRKYTDQNYIVHPRAVADLVRTVQHTPEMVAAALLHDVLEDTTVTEDELRSTLGDHVARLVIELTDRFGPGQGDRAMRKVLESERLARASAEAQTVKLADIIDNLQSIVPDDAGFGRVFLKEAERLVSALQRAEPAMIRRAQQALVDSHRHLQSARVGVEQP